ncbi:MAG: hypothetical protein Q8P83_00350 [bacterium]|nr:hypothetical protein [bacterium]
MFNQKNYIQGLIHALGVFAYTILVAWFMFNAEKFFGEVDTFWAPVAMLLLFVISATIVGSLVLGRPAYLFWNGEKFEALKLLSLTVSWLVVITIIVLAVQLS